MPVVVAVPVCEGVPLLESVEVGDTESDCVPDELGVGVPLLESVDVSVCEVEPLVDTDADKLDEGEMLSDTEDVGDGVGADETLSIDEAVVTPEALGDDDADEVAEDVAHAEANGLLEVAHGAYTGGVFAGFVEQITRRTREPSATKMAPVPEWTRTALGAMKVAAEPTPSAHAELPLPAIVVTKPVESEIARRREVSSSETMSRPADGDTAMPAGLEKSEVGPSI